MSCANDSLCECGFDDWNANSVILSPEEVSDLATLWE